MLEWLVHRGFSSAILTSSSVKLLPRLPSDVRDPGINMLAGISRPSEFTIREPVPTVWPDKRTFSGNGPRHTTLEGSIGVR